jgi:hemoglobin
VRPTLFEFAGGSPAFLALAAARLDEAAIPTDPEFRAAERGYMRWAVDDVLSYSSPEAVVASGQPMPRWWWDGVEQSYEMLPP